MSVLVDTNVWVDFFGRGDAELAALLTADRVVMHEAVLGELACGNLARRVAVLAALRAIRTCPSAPPSACLAIIEGRRLFGIGIGWVDVQLLAAASTARLALWTRDLRLRRAAQAAGVAVYRP